MKLEDLKPFFLEDIQVYGISNFSIEGLKAMHEAKSNHMTFILASRLNQVQDLLDHPAQVIITDYEVKDIEDLLISRSKTVLNTKNPRMQMAKFSHLFDRLNKSISIVSTSIMKNLNKLEGDIEIGEGTIIHAGAILYEGVKIGSNCIIHGGAVIGADGFGYEQDPHTKEWFKIAHLGNVQIGNNVEIGANACIDRGTLGSTILEDGVKIDNLVHIAHNVHMKKNSVAIALSMIAGSCIVEEGAWIAPCSSIREGRRIGKNALVGLGSVVIKDVQDDQVVMGVPAKPK